MISFKRFTTTLSWLWLSIFAITPIMTVVVISLLHYDTDTLYQRPFTLANYKAVFDQLTLMVFYYSIKYATICTLLCLMIAYPFAYNIAQANKKFRNVALMFVIIPFWTSSLVRTYAIMAILKTKGLLNTLLLQLGLIHHPLQILYSNTAMMIGLVYTLVPFMILPLYANMTKLDHNLVDAARDLGATRLTIFSKIILPQTKPGILSGIMMVFLPAMSLFYLPSLLGGSKSLLLGNLIVMQYLYANNWPMGSAVSVMLMLLMLIMLIYYWRHTESSDRRDLL